MVQTIEEIMLTLKMMDDRKAYLDAEKEKPVVEKPAVVKKPVVEKPTVIREACFEVGTFYYNWRDDGEDYSYRYNIYNKKKTVAYAVCRMECYDNEYRTEDLKMVIKYSLKHKCEYFKHGSTTILCKKLKKEE